jgi:eukaryotic-like serine/threonine-protein kinase
MFCKGHCLGAYRIERLLGSGAFAEVYLARNTILDKEVALKVVHSTDAESMEQQGARIMCRLNHPNIVQVHSADRIDHRLVIAMDYIRGITLKEVLDEKAPLDSSTAMAIALAIVEALDYVHTLKCEQFCGIAHLDLKPSNILIDEEGVVKITDFGMAQLLANGTDPETRIGGSPTYMAPEQYSGNPCLQSDLWAVGVLLYQMLIEEAPFRASSIEDYRRQVFEYDPETDHRLSSLPGKIRFIISRCLQRDLSQRFGSARELVEEFENISCGKQMRKCPSCGSVVPQESAICPECTYREKSSLIQTAPWLEDRQLKKKARRKRSFVWVAVFGLVILLALGYAGYRALPKWRPGPPMPENAVESYRAKSRRMEPQKQEYEAWIAAKNLEMSYDGTYEDRVRAFREFLASYPGSAEAKDAEKKISLWEGESSRFAEAKEIENLPGARICERLAKWTEFHKSQQTGFRRAYAWQRMQHWQKEVENYVGYAELTIKSASGLPPSDNEILGSSQPDPYFVLIQDKKVIYRSRTMKDTPSPDWGDKVRIFIRPLSSPALEIRDADPIGYDLLMHQELSSLPVDGVFRVSSDTIEVEMEILRER